MTDQNENINTRRKRLIFRSWHRGTKEMDIILGEFADAHMHDFDAAQLDAYERLMQNSDPDLYNWISGSEPVPPSQDSDVFQMLLADKAA